MLVIDPAAFTQAAEALMIAVRSCRDMNGLRVSTHSLTPRLRPDEIPMRIGSASSEVNPFRDGADDQRIRAITLGAVVALVNGAAYPGDETHLAGFPPPQHSVVSPSEDIIAAIAVRWKQTDGPPHAYVEYHDGAAGGRSVFVSWNGAKFCDAASPHGAITLFESPRDAADRLVAGVDEYAAMHGATPESHKIVWRVRPQFESPEIGGMVQLRARMAFLPLSAVVDMGDGV